MGHDGGWRPPCPGCAKGSSPWSAEGRDRFRLLVHRRCRSGPGKLHEQREFNEEAINLYYKSWNGLDRGRQGRQSQGYLQGYPKSGGLLQPYLLDVHGEGRPALPTQLGGKVPSVPTAAVLNRGSCNSTPIKME